MTDKDITLAVVLDHVQGLSFGIDGLGQKMKKVEHKMDKMEQSMGKVEKKLVEHDHNFDRIECRLNVIQVGVDNIDKRLDTIEIEQLPKRVSNLERHLGLAA